MLDTRQNPRAHCFQESCSSSGCNVCTVQVRKPLSALRTLGAMLLPRLQEGRPDRDMASGILVQVTSRTIAPSQTRCSPQIGSASMPCVQSLREAI